MFSQVWPGSCVFLWREWRLQAGDLWGGELLENPPKEVTEDVRLCTVPFSWVWPFLRKLLGHCAILQAYHHHRQVCSLMYGWCDVGSSCNTLLMQFDNKLITDKLTDKQTKYQWLVLMLHCFNPVLFCFSWRADHSAKNWGSYWGNGGSVP